ncbi:unnamed protein product [Citrullus colocynthis]|uniref:Uncharacterized protein n=1 Tax=Citrullus colocynthis TaxID=252529 RepID=A0ABP0YWL6_9ROSI
MHSPSPSATCQAILSLAVQSRKLAATVRTVSGGGFDNTWSNVFVNDRLIVERHVMRRKCFSCSAALTVIRQAIGKCLLFFLKSVNQMELRWRHVANRPPPGLSPFVFWLFRCTPRRRTAAVTSEDCWKCRVVSSYAQPILRSGLHQLRRYDGVSLVEAGSESISGGAYVRLSESGLDNPRTCPIENSPRGHEDKNITTFSNTAGTCSTRTCVAREESI